MVKFYNIAEIAEKFEYDNLQMSWSIKSRLRELTGLEENVIIFNNSNKMSEFLLVKDCRCKGIQNTGRKYSERISTGRIRTDFCCTS